MSCTHSSMRAWLLLGLAVHLGAYLAFRHEDLYMDEVFHVRQAQQYCLGNFIDWDPKITTFPGLYYLSVAVQWLLGGTECNPAMLRAISFLLSCSLVPLLTKCRAMITGSADHIPILLYIYPCSALYYCLYYTDTASEAAFLLCYWRSRAGLSPNKSGDSPLLHRRRQVDSAIDFVIAMAAVLMRQTNSVWLLFIAGSLMVEELERAGKIRSGADLSPASLWEFVAALYSNLSPLLGITWAYLLPVVGFIVFVVGVNGGSVVVGDRDNHSLALHWAMLVYPAGIYVAMTGARMALTVIEAVRCHDEEAQKWLRRLRLGRAAWLCVFAAGALAIWRGSLSHPFLLADNRHYTFYVWRRILQPDWSRALLSGAMGVSAVLTLSDLRRRRSGVWLVVLLCAMVLTLIPTPLLEPRYFTQAVTVMLLNSPEVADTRESRLALNLQLWTVIVINMLVVYVFLYVPFTWGDGTLARFMF